MLSFLHEISLNQVEDNNTNHDHLQKLTRNGNIIKIFIDKNGTVKKSEPVSKTEEYNILGTNNQNRALTVKIKDTNKLMENYLLKMINSCYEFKDKLDPLGEEHPAIMLLSALTNRHKDVEVFAKEIADIYQIEKETVLLFENVAVGYSFHVPEIYKSVSNQLHKATKEENIKINENNEAKKSVDAFGYIGVIDDSAWQASKFGSPVGNLSPFQCNSDNPCSNRYGLNSTNTFALTRETRQKLQKAFSSLFHATNKGSIWNRFSDKKTDTIYYTVIYPIGFYDTDIMKEIQKIIDANRDEDEDEDLSKEQDMDMIFKEFKNKGTQICNAISGKVEKDGKDSKMIKFEIMCFSKKGDSPIRPIIHERVYLEELEEKINEWCSASVSGMQIRGPLKIGSKELELRTISVFQAMRILNKVWTRGAGVDGKGSLIKSYGDNISRNVFSMRDILSIFLRNNQIIVDRAISHLANSHTDLLYDVRERCFHSDSPSIYQHRKDVLSLPALIGILFEKKGISMDDVTGTTAYTMGEVLGFADRIHSKWYFDKKKPSSSSPKFIGSTCFHSLHRKGDSARNWNTFLARFKFFKDWAMANGITEYKEVRDRIEAIGKNPIILKTDEDVLMFALGYFSK